MNVFRTFIVPAAKGALAVRITDALGYPEKGMFTAKVMDGGDPETDPPAAWISTGILDDTSPIHADAAGLLAALDERNLGHGITLAQCQSFRDALDLTDSEPFARMDFVREEIALGATAVPWVQPPGAADAYPLDAVVSYGGKAWRNITPANVWQPGVSGWRLLWATTAAAPEWVQPTGGHDVYHVGDIVTYQGKTWKCVAGDASGANSWAPGVYGWQVI